MVGLNLKENKFISHTIKGENAGSSSDALELSGHMLNK